MKERQWDLEQKWQGKVMRHLLLVGWLEGQEPKLPYQIDTTIVQIQKFHQ